MKHVCTRNHTKFFSCPALEALLRKPPNRFFMFFSPATPSSSSPLLLEKHAVTLYVCGYALRLKSGMDDVCVFPLPRKASIFQLDMCAGEFFERRHTARHGVCETENVVDQEYGVAFGE